MEDEKQPETQPSLMSVESLTEIDIRQVDLEGPISTGRTADDHQIANLYRLAAENSQKLGNNTSSLVYSLFQSLMDLHFKPEDRAEPFGPMFVFEDRRSLIVSDLSMKLVEGLCSIASEIKNPTVRARISDVAWTANRRLGQCAATAIDAYCEMAERVRSGEFLREDDRDVTAFDVIVLLRRAAQISVLTKPNNEIPERLKNLLRVSREDAFSRKDLPGFFRAADLDLDYEISKPFEIGEKAEKLASGEVPSVNGHMTLSLLEIAGRAYRAAKETEAANRATIAAAEWCVECGNSLSGSPILHAHWLTRAIMIYGGVRSEKKRRAELRKQLIDVQANALDEFSPIGHSTDISEIVGMVKERFSGKPLAAVLRSLILAARSPEPSVLMEEADKAIRQSPLSSLFSTQIVDNEGKVKFHSPGMGKNNENAGITRRHKILQNEDIRLGLTYRSTLNVARALINAEHRISEEILLPLVQASPLIPPGHELIFARGFARWFGGDLISATSILVPQFENSIRYALKNAGFDVSTMKNDSTQEDRSIQAIFDQMRSEVVDVFGEAITFQIENLFLIRMGPAVRHSVAHGQFSTGSFFSDAAGYACWFLFHLTMLPLFEQWDEIEAYLNSL